MDPIDFFEKLGRKLIITGHYGSGKTEFAVSLAMLRAKRNPAAKQALIDLDVINPYFRSRERRGMLEQAGVSVCGSLYKTEITAEMPALGANVRAPLEDNNCSVIIDAGGNDSGAIVLNQFKKYFFQADTTTLAVVNANRPDTMTVAGAVGHITAIEYATGLEISGIINNTHLLRETDAETIKKGHLLCREICLETGKKFLCDCYPAEIISKDDISDFSEISIPLGLFMAQYIMNK